MSGDEKAGEDFGLLAIANSLGIQSKRVQQAITVYVAGTTAWRGYVGIRDKKRDRNRFHVSVEESDPIYDLVQRWLIDQIPSEERKALVVRSPGSSPSPVSRPSDDDDRELPDLAVYYDSHHSQTITVEGHAVEVEVGDRKVSQRSSRASGGSFVPPQAFTFSVLGSGGRDAVLRLLKKISDDYHRQPKRSGRLFVSTDWGNWKRRSDLPMRKLETVILPQGLKEDLVTDLTRFLEDEDRYVSLGLPWHRGFLFYGPPGTGKTSLGKALACHFNLDIHAMSIPSLRTDDNLSELMGSISPRSILLLEDIDVVQAAKDRDSESPGVTTAGLLNALDGFATPHGLVTIMTANDETKLDPALVRPGRVDRRFLINYLDQDQAERLAGMVVGRPRLPLPTIPENTVSPAELVEQAKTLLHDPKAAEEALIKFAGGF